MRIGTRQRQLDAFANCGNSLWLKRDGNELVLISNTCRHRACDPCNVARRQQLVDRVVLAVAEAKLDVRHVTLTLKCQPVGLKSQVDRLYASFRRMRDNKFWREHVPGGIAFFETKLGKNTHDWHVHFHIICETSWLDHKRLCEEWHKVTGDSFITYVEPIGNPQRRALYVTKYATKPLDQTVTNSPAHLDEAQEVLKGRRLFFTFGTWKKLQVDDDEEGGRQLTSVGSLSMLQSDASAGDATARRWLEAAHRKWPSLATWFPLRPPPPDEHDPP